jgi:DNA-binding transcriptional regulator YhcF (GntR family)
MMTNQKIWLRTLDAGRYAVPIISALHLFENNPREPIFPSINTIAKITGISRSTTKRTLRNLEKLGHILTARSITGTSNTYVIRWPDWTLENHKNNTSNSTRKTTLIHDLTNRDWAK